MRTKDYQSERGGHLAQGQQNTGMVDRRRTMNFFYADQHPPLLLTAMATAFLADGVDDVAIGHSGDEHIIVSQSRALMQEFSFPLAYPRQMGQRGRCHFKVGKQVERQLHHSINARTNHGKRTGMPRPASGCEKDRRIQVPLPPTSGRVAVGSESKLCCGAQIGMGS